MTQLDVIEAKKALAVRLRLWGVEVDAAKKADGFIDDLVGRGWQMAPFRETRPQPPKAEQQCPSHLGQRAGNCGGCRADQLAEDRPPSPVPSWTPGDTAAGARAVRDALRAVRGNGNDEEGTQ